MDATLLRNSTAPLARRFACRVPAALACLVASGLPLAAVDAPAKATWPPASCRVAGLDEEIRCGVYEVYENRATRQGAKIPMKVVVLPATGKSRLPDPLVCFAGGPGDSVIRGAGFLGAAYKKLREARDIVLIDVRGTGESAALMCDELSGEQGIQTFLTEFLRPRGVKDCYERLKARDLNQYTTDSAVDDVDEICAALGYPRVNLMGVSYGTRVALVYMRRHPAKVRSAVLIGVVPTGDRTPLTFARDAQNALDGLLAECAADPACSKAFPNASDEFRAVFERLGGAPVEVSVKNQSSGEAIPLMLTRTGFAQTIRYMLYLPQTAVQIPQYVHEAARGNFQPLADTAYFFSTALTAGRMSDGYFLCVTCAEDVPWIMESDVAVAVKGTFLGDFRIRQQQAACAEWPVGKAAADFLKPVVSDVPALLISGERDPVTPAQVADLVARGLSHSRHVVVPDGAHGFDGMKGAECIDEVIMDFIAAGSAESVDVSCVKAIERPAFLLETPVAKVLELPAAKLQSCVGTYVLAEAGLTVDVTFENDRLRAVLPGQPPFLLEAVSETRFRFAGLPYGYFIEFHVKEGVVTGASMEAGAGTAYELKRQPAR